MLATPLPSPVVIDYFETTLAAPVGAGADVTATLTSITNNENTPVQIPTTGYGVISPNSTTGLKEIVLYDTLNVGAKTVRLHERGLTTTSGTLDQSHSAGETFAIPITANYLNDVVKLIQDTSVGHTHDGTDSKKVDLSAPNPIGSVTPNTGAFTTLSTTGAITAGGNVAVTGSVNATVECIANNLLLKGAAADSTFFTIGGLTQTTVGAAGGGTALPATPLGYLLAKRANVPVAIPYYPAA